MGEQLAVGGSQLAEMTSPLAPLLAKERGVEREEYRVDDLLSVSMIAKVMHIDYSTVMKLVENGSLKIVSIPGCCRKIRWGDYLEMVQRFTVSDPNAKVEELKRGLSWL